MWQRLALDKEPFRLGIQNSKNAIEQALKDVNLFTTNDGKTVCKLLQMRKDMQNMRLENRKGKFVKVPVHGKFLNPPL